MEDNIVLTDEMDKACLGVFPPFFPWSVFIGLGVAEFLGIGDISDGCVEPDVEHFSLGALHGNGDTPVEVACDGTRTQTAVEPALALAIDVGPPFLVLVQNPVLEPGLVLVEG